MTSPHANGNSSGQHEWWAVYTRHQHEKSVVENLSANDIETFLPVYKVVRQWKDRRKQISLPLFPCYVFVCGSCERRTQVLSAPGVFSIVSVAGRPAPIPAAQIDAIRRAVGSSLHVEPHPFLHCGDWVRIKSGPLMDVEGVLIRKKGSYRLILSAELLQKSMAVEVDAFSVEPLVRQTDGTHPCFRPQTLVQNHTAAGWQERDHREYGERLS
jgi:transcription antitermination factor NusG